MLKFSANYKNKLILEVTVIEMSFLHRTKNDFYHIQFHNTGGMKKKHKNQM